MKCKRIVDDILEEAFDSAARRCKEILVDEGKYELYVEKIDNGVYGLYKQVYDGPDGDDWVSYIVRLQDGCVYVIDEKHSEYGHFGGGEWFRERYMKIPLGLVKERLE